VAIVDDEDYDWLMQYKWSLSGNGYAQGWNGKVILMHRLIMGLNSPEVDHINRNPLDNRRSNLRHCTSGQNKVNTKLRKDNTTGYRGVDFMKNRKKWRARAGMEYIGMFSTSEEAARAYDKKIEELFGDKTYKNFQQQKD